MSKYGDDFDGGNKNMFSGFGWKGRKRGALDVTGQVAKDAVKETVKGFSAAGLAAKDTIKETAQIISNKTISSAAMSGSGSTATAGSTAYAIGDYDENSGLSGWLRRLFGRGGEAWIGALALAFTLGVGGLIVKDAINAKYKDKTGVKRILPLRWNERTLVFPIEGADAAGRRALFDVVVLTKNYGWTLGSTEELERGSQKLTAEEIQDEVLAPQLREGLGRAKELIAVGVASQEGDVEKETHRAGLRAKRTAEWVKGVVADNIPMWTLNLGRYTDVCTDCEEGDTSWQRPFMVVAVKQSDPGTNLAEALNNALSDKENLPSPSRYSSFALAKWGK